MLLKIKTKSGNPVLIDLDKIYVIGFNDNILFVNNQQIILENEEYLIKMFNFVENYMKNCIKEGNFTDESI